MHLQAEENRFEAVLERSQQLKRQKKIRERNDDQIHLMIFGDLDNV